MDADNESLPWEIRAYVYKHFAETTRPPSIEETSKQFSISVEQAASQYQKLHNHHALFLEPNTLRIRMANPFSGVPTDFKVYANENVYYANCAWDMLGIPAALHSDATLEAHCADSNEQIQINVRNGKVSESEVKINFPLPFSRWYDDLIFT